MPCALDKPSISLRTPATPAEWDAVRDIFREYASTLGIDLCFQDFESELAQLPGDYAEPRGALLVAEVEGALAGCCALRPLDNADYPNASEMKRLYVRKAFRGFGLGRELAEAMLDPGRYGVGPRAIHRPGLRRNPALLPQPHTRGTLPQGRYFLTI